MYHYSATLIRVVDGDTCDVQIDLGLSIYHETRIRLYGINAPELNKPGGMEAKMYLIRLLDKQVMRIKTIKDRKEKYGRYLALIECDGVEVNAEMVRSGHAVEATY